MHINIHDVHVEALNFVTLQCMDAISWWIKQCDNVVAILSAVWFTAISGKHFGTCV